MSALATWTEPISAHAHAVDWLTLSLLALAFLLSAPVFILMLYYAVKYRRGKPADRRHPVNRRVGLEIAWTIVPFILTMVFFVWATKLFVDLHQPPPDALEIDVVAKQWMWKFQHPGGQREINDLHVPVGEAIRLRMASQDVIHSLFIPALRLKQDVVPGRYTTLWFNADKTGEFRIACAEFCGTDHSVMGGHLIVLSRSDYEAWLAGFASDGSLVAQGKALFRSSGCSGCHGVAATVHAPPLEGLYGSPVPLDSGAVVTADDQHIRDSILLPQSQIAAGYPAIMPTYANILGEDDVLKLIAYIKSIGRKEPAS